MTTYNDDRLLGRPTIGDMLEYTSRSLHTQGGHLTEIQILQLVQLIKDGIPAGQACKAVGISQTALSRRLTEARRAAKGASEAERAGQRYYPLLKAYESAQAERSKTLRKLRGHPEEKKMALERHPLIHRDLMTFPKEEREKLMDHIRHGSYVAHAAQSVRVHAVVAERWMQRGQDAFLSDQDDPESLEYMMFYLDVYQAFGEANTDASERVFSTAPISYLLFGPGRETESSPGWQKNPRMAPQAAKQRLEIKTVWATAQHSPAVIHGKLQPFKVEVPLDSDYQPLDRSNWPSEDEN